MYVSLLVALSLVASFVAPALSAPLGDVTPREPGTSGPSLITNVLGRYVLMARDDSEEVDRPAFGWWKKSALGHRHAQ